MLKKQPSPPKYAQKFLYWFIKPELEEEVIGDLEEKFEKNLKIKSPFKAKANYWYQTLHYFRPFAIKNNLITDSKPFFMWRNYCKITWRNLIKQPIHSSLNLLCLTLGIAAAMVILLYVHFESTYDLFHEKSDRIFLVETEAITTNSKTIEVDWQSTSALIAPYMQQDYPEVEATVRLYSFFQNESIELENEGHITPAQDVSVADASVLDIFTFDFIYGSPEDALDGPNKLIISESLARQVFGNTDPVGKILNTELSHSRPNFASNYALVVSGVYKDFSDNSHLAINGLISAETDPALDNYYFNFINFSTYALLKKGVASNQLAEKLSDIYRNYLDAEIEPVLKEAKHVLTPLTSIHLSETGGPTYLYIFAAIGLLMLLISIISYVNLVTAQASKRALEIGVRKVMGSNRQQLMGQFLTESVFFSCLALGLALVLVLMAISPLNDLLGLQLDARQLGHPPVILGMGIILLIIGILGGAYPAFFLSAFQPIAVLKGKLVKGTAVRRVLVATQFAVVIFVLISTGMVYDQLQFMRAKDLGFNKEQVVHLPLTAAGALEKMDVLKTTLAQNPQVKSLGTANFLPGLGMIRRPISADNGTDKDAQFVHAGYIDYGYLPTLDIEVVAGRNFSEQFPNDTTENVLVNQQFAQNFGLENPVGEKIRYGDSGNPNYKTIVGVVEDFHQSTLHEPIASQLFILSPASHHLAVKLEGNLSSGIADLEQRWLKVFPNETFTYRFLDDDLATAYETNQIRGRIFLLFSSITVIIAFLGLFGLVAYIAKQRVKEIGIRRVLGASSLNVVTILSKDFLILISLSAIPAFLAAWYFIQHWLTDFAYRTAMNYGLFVLVLGFMLVLTLLITSLHAFRTLRQNPVNSLRTE